MELEEATLDQIGRELKKRPIHFVFAAIEDVGAGSGDVWHSDLEEGIELAKRAAYYLMEQKQE